MGSTCSAEPQNRQEVPNNKQHPLPGIIVTTDDAQSPVSELFQPQSKMARRVPPERTISHMKKQKDAELFRRNPEMKKVLDEFDDVSQRLQKAVDNEDFEDDEEDLKKLLHEKLLEPFKNHVREEQRLMMGDHLADIGFLKPLVDLYVKLLNEHDLDEGISPSLEEEDENETYFKIIKDIRTILWNFSDSSKDFGLAIPEQTNLFQELVKDLQSTFNEGLENLDAHEFCFNSAVAIITNCARAGVNKSSFNVIVDKKTRGDNDAVDIQMVDVLKPFLQSKIQFIKLTTLMALSYMVNEDQSKFLTADLTLIDFLLDMIEAARKDKDQRYEGFSVHELIDGLAGLAQNDDNKVKIMDKKSTYKMLKDLVMNDQAENQQLASVRAIWELSFAEKNKKKFLSDKELIAQLEVLQGHTNQDLANAAGKSLFVINPESEKNLMRSVDDQKSKLEHPEKEHIMISYQWGNQKIILQIRDKLRENGFPVWIDVDFMEGSMLQMMASAIEKAKVVLICYSEKYKDSKNCRTEAEYAFARDKIIVPLLLQNGYRPDGWLGILVGSKKFYDFSGKYPFDKKFYELKSELGGLMGPKIGNIELKQPVPPSASVHEVPDDFVLFHWKKQDIETWLQKNDLQAFSGLHSLTGEQIGFLYKLFRRAPDFFYKCLETKLGLKSLEDLMKFDKALENLSKQHPEINKLLH